MINLAIKCRKCGQWGHKRTQDVDSAIFQCFVCNTKGKLKDYKGNWNYNHHIIQESLFENELVAKLNQRDNAE